MLVSHSLDFDPPGTDGGQVLGPAIENGFPTALATGVALGPSRMTSQPRGAGSKVNV